MSNASARLLRLLAGLCLFWAIQAHAAVLFVNVDSTNPVSPFSSWATAATNIQDALDTAHSGDSIVVTDGVYQIGSRISIDGTMNRVVVSNAVAISSVNGPAVTTINAASAMRCLYLTNGASISGFSLVSGSANYGGGVWCSSSNCVISNCVISGSYAYSAGAGVYGGTLQNCQLLSNGSQYGAGAGAESSTIYNSIISGNVCVQGGGADNCFISNCIVSQNSGSDSGGGASGCVIYNSWLTNNNSYQGGGAFGSTLYNCFISTNTAHQGAGIWSSTAYNCTLTLNYANLTLSGGAGDSTLDNCILFNNAGGGPANYDDTCTMNYCCTTPLPDGTNNIDADPMLCDGIHIFPDSPCQGAGSSAFSTGTDIDGEAWANPPSIGCDEYVAGGVLGPITAGIQAPITRFTTNSPGTFQSSITGRFDAIRWDFGDGTIESNTQIATHTWNTIGNYQVTLTVYNDALTNGVSASVSVQVDLASDIIYHVAADSTNPVAPYSSWSTAATNIQDAVNVAVPGTLVLVSNGIYQVGMFTTLDNNSSRLEITKPLTVQSLNGPTVTVIQGTAVFPTARCVCMSDQTFLSGFTLENGDTELRGHSGPYPNGCGGVLCTTGSAVVSNCVITNCSGDLVGGAECYTDAGAQSLTLYDCTVVGNSATHSGGAFSCTLINCFLAFNIGYGSGGAGVGCAFYNCTLVSNSAAGDGGGTLSSTLANCIVQFNTASSAANYYSSTLNYCCTSPMPTDGIGNITNNPLFVNPAAGDFHLQSNSPCINAGNNAYVSTTNDLDGNPRISSGTVDIGAYEFQNPASIISYAWLEQYGFATDGSADFADPDHDGMNNYQEWRAGTDPTNPLSLLEMLSAGYTNNPPGLTVTWQSVANINYYLQRATNLTSVPAFQTIATGIPGQTGTTSFSDTNTPPPGPYFYRVGVQ